MKGISLSGYAIINSLPYSKGNFLEIGCFDGANIASIAKENPHKIIYGIDPFICNDEHLQLPVGTKLNNQKINLYENIKNLSNVKFFETTTEQFSLSQSEEDIKNMNVDLIFIDGAHVFDFITHDVDLSINLILNNSFNGGIVVFDDLHIKDVIKGINYMCEKLINLNIKFEYNINNIVIKK